jgi:cation diffusion facilitator family transporter
MSLQTPPMGAHGSATALGLAQAETHPQAHAHDLSPFTHSHAFADEGQRRRARALTGVTVLTLLTMVAELLAGWWTGSLALTADGWHMGTHALALGGAVLAYRLSQAAAQHRAVPGGPAGYAFGGWKIEVLSAYTSGLLLMGVALWLGWEGMSALRSTTREVDFADALVVAVIGLVVNLASMVMLHRGSDAPAPVAPAASAAHGPTDGHGHDHDHDHDHAHGHAHGRAHGHSHGHAHGHSHGPAGGAHDHNFKAAYLHVLADAFTSVLAIAALAGGAWFGLGWLDPAVALLGAAVIAHWSWGMLRSTSRALVDATEDPALTQRIRDLIQADGDAQVADLHVWQVGAQAWSAALSVVADAPLPAAAYRDRLGALAQLKHVTVEVHVCPGSAIEHAHPHPDSHPHPHPHAHSAP